MNSRATLYAPVCLSIGGSCARSDAARITTNQAADSSSLLILFCFQSLDLDKGENS